MEIKTLTLRNFKGIQDFTLDTKDGLSVNIYGRNGAGKTTIFDAWKFLLFGKDSLDRQKFGVRPIFIGNDEPTVVEAVISLDKPFEVKLRKSYKEVWAKPKGKPEREFRGFKTECYIDDVVVPPNEFDAYINDTIPEERFKILTDPRYFNDTLHWSKRRDILLQAFGRETTIDDVIAYNPAELSDLPEMLAGRHPSEVYTESKDVLKRRKARLSQIPAIREDKTNNLPGPIDYTDVTVESLMKEKKKIQDDLDVILTGSESPKLLAILKHARAELKTVIEQKETALNEKKRGINTSINTIETKVSQKRRHLSQIMADESVAITQRDSLRKQWESLYIPPGEAKDYRCPYCDKPMDADKIAEAEKKRLEALHNVTEDGKAFGSKVTELQAQGKSITEEINSLNNQLPDLEKELAKVNEVLKSIEKMPEVKQVQLKVNTAQADYDASNAAPGEEVIAFKSRLEEIDKEIPEVGKIQAARSQREEGLKQIKELEKEEKTVSAEIEKLEKVIYLIEVFNRSTVEMLEGHINSQFEIVSFRMFDYPQSGGVVDTCEVISKETGVPYRDLSKGESLRAGMDVIKTLSKYYGQVCPIFIDNREGVTFDLDTDSQVINLRVDPMVPELKVQIIEEVTE